MKKLLTLLTCLTVLLPCNNLRKDKSNCAAEASAIEASANSETSHGADNGVKESLNDIRFAGWGRNEWADNEYIRTLRRYLDAYNSGKIEDARLDEYKDYIKGKFVIADIEPYIVGGAYISIIFYDNPDKIFSAVVYSDVDEKTRVVSNYECRGLKNENLDLKFSQEDIRQFLKECPEHRLW